MRNRLLERNNIGSTYLLTKFAKPLLLRIVGRARMGFAPAGCVSGLFWISKCLKDYSLFITLVGKGGGYLGITWFSEGTTGDHLFPRVYGADYRMWLLLLTSTIIRTLQSLMGVGGRSGKFYRDSSKILLSSLLHVNSCKLLYTSLTITV